MYNKIKLLVFLLCLSPCSILAQNIQVLMSPKPSPYISDWQQQTETVKLVISNSSSKEIEVKIKTELYDGKGALIANTDDSKMPVLTIPPTSTTTYNPEDIIPSNSISYKGGVSEKAIIQTGRIPDDNYRLCVTLIDPNGGKPVGTSGTVCKVFTIVAYQAPTLINPTNKEIIKGAAIKGIVFRWSPVIPSPKTIVTYRLQVWEVLEGQNSMTALRSNQPIIEKDLKGMLQTQWPIDFPLPDTGKPYVWTITPLDDDGRKMVDGSGFSEPFEFRACCWPPPISLPPEDPDIILISPANNEEIKGDIKFNWGDPHEVPGDGYTLRIVELKGDQSPDVAIANNPSVFEQKGIMGKSFKLGDSVGKLKEGKKYAWSVKGNNGFSEPHEFSTQNVLPPLADPTPIPIMLVSPANNSQLDTSGEIKFTWTSAIPSNKEPRYRLKIWQLMEGQTYEDAKRANKPIIEKEVNQQLEIPISGLYTGPCKPPYLCDYIWNVQALDKNGTLINNGVSETFTYKFRRDVDPKGRPSSGYRMIEMSMGIEAKSTNDPLTNCILDGDGCAGPPPAIKGSAPPDNLYYGKIKRLDYDHVQLQVVKKDSNITESCYQKVFASGYYSFSHPIYLNNIPRFSEVLEVNPEFVVPQGKYKVTQVGNLIMVDFPNAIRYNPNDGKIIQLSEPQNNSIITKNSQPEFSWKIEAKEKENSKMIDALKKQNATLTLYKVTESEYEKIINNRSAEIELTNIYYQNTQIQGNSFLYPKDAPPLMPGIFIAWTISIDTFSSGFFTYRSSSDGCTDPNIPNLIYTCANQGVVFNGTYTPGNYNIPGGTVSPAGTISTSGTNNFSISIPGSQFPSNGLYTFTYIPGSSGTCFHPPTFNLKVQVGPPASLAAIINSSCVGCPARITITGLQTLNTNQAYISQGNFNCTPPSGICSSPSSTITTSNMHRYEFTPSVAGNYVINFNGTITVNLPGGGTCSFNFNYNYTITVYPTYTNSNIRINACSNTVKSCCNIKFVLNSFNGTTLLPNCSTSVSLPFATSGCTPSYRYLICRNASSVPNSTSTYTALPPQASVSCDNLHNLIDNTWYSFGGTNSLSNPSESLQFLPSGNYTVYCNIVTGSGCCFSGFMTAPYTFTVPVSTVFNPASPANGPIVCSAANYPASDYHMCCAKKFEVKMGSSCPGSTMPTGGITYRWLISRSASIIEPNKLPATTTLADFDAFYDAFNTIYPPAGYNCFQRVQLPVGTWYRFGGTSASPAAPSFLDQGSNYFVACFVFVNCTNSNYNSAWAISQRFNIVNTDLPVILDQTNADVSLLTPLQICSPNTITLHHTPDVTADATHIYSYQNTGSWTVSMPNETTNLNCGTYTTKLKYQFKVPASAGEPGYGNGTATPSCVINSPLITLNVLCPSTPTIVISSIPSVTNVCPGTTIVFSAAVTNGGSSPNYQWMLNGVVVGTGATYTTSAYSNGDVVQCVLTSNDPCANPNTATSNSMTITTSSTLLSTGPITGNINVCSPSTQTYSIPLVPGATSYNWNLPTGWTGSSNTNTINANVMSGAVGGQIRVTAIGPCGSSNQIILNVNVVSGLTIAGPISGNITVCTPSTQTYSIPAVAGATYYIWNVPTGFMGSSSTNSITVNVIGGTVGGQISVMAVGPCGNSNQLVLNVTAVPGVNSTISANNGSRNGPGTVNISTSNPGSSYTIDWYANPSGGSVLSGGSGTVNFTTPFISTTTTYYAQIRNTSTNCISNSRVPVIATINSCNCIVALHPSSTTVTTPLHTIVSGTTYTVNFQLNNTSNCVQTFSASTPSGTIIPSGLTLTVPIGISSHTVSFTINATASSTISQMGVTCLSYVSTLSVGNSNCAVQMHIDLCQH